jgi:hypothetical protein
MAILVNILIFSDVIDELLGSHIPVHILFLILLLSNFGMNLMNRKGELVRILRFSATAALLALNVSAECLIKFGIFVIQVDDKLHDYIVLVYLFGYLVIVYLASVPIFII